VNSLADELDGSCADGDCSLRDAIAIANANGDEDEISFAVTGTIALALGSLEISEDGARIVADGTVTVDASALLGLAALVIAADDCTIEGLEVTGATGGAHGIIISGSGNRLLGNRIAGNSGSGIAVTPGAGPRNTFRGNALAGNGGPGIDLGADGAGNPPGGPNGGLQPPAIATATTQGVAGTTQPGWTVEVFLVGADGEEGEISLGVTTADSAGSFVVPLAGVSAGSLVTATATAGLPLGTPVWGERHCFPQSDYVDPGNLAYRTCCTANGWIGAALGAHILGMRGLWNHEPFFDYVDRYVASREPGDWTRSWSSFVEEMWEEYRAAYGPIWPDGSGGD
jgi:CSLREA domain-containing protein